MRANTTDKKYNKYRSRTFGVQGIDSVPCSKIWLQSELRARKPMKLIESDASCLNIANIYDPSKL